MKRKFQNAALNPGSLLVFTHEGDPYFYGSVVLLLAHDLRGSLGIIINKVNSEIDYQDVVKAMDGLDVLKAQAEENKVVLLGGPEEDRMVLIYEEQDAEKANAKLAYSDSTEPGFVEQCHALAAADKTSVRFACGDAGWGVGQLAAEVRGGHWRVLPYNADLVFNCARKDIWARAAKEAGFHKDLIRYIQNPAALREEKGGVLEALKYLESKRPKPPQA